MKIVRKITLILFSILIIYFVTIQFFISQVAKEKPIKQYDYLLILGTKLDGTKPSTQLKNRLDKGLEYLLLFPNTTIIVAGGQGTDEQIPEAQSMKEYLISKGIDSNQIITEDKSHNTYENLKFSSKYTNNKDKVLVVSSKYHLFRTKILASELGIHIETLGSATPKKDIIWYSLREYLAVIKMYLLKFGR